MALFMKQDFNPPVLSRKWMSIKFRPNMLLYSRDHIISILESGLLFREDSVDVEQGAPSPEEVWSAANGAPGGWFTYGESVIAAAAVAGCMFIFPPRSFDRSALINIGAYVTVPLAVRALHRHSSRRTALNDLLELMKEYLTLARRLAACLMEYRHLHTQIDSLSTVVESAHTMLCRQQSELAILMSRASSALLGNAPWLRADIAWEAVPRENSDNLQKIHHAFLVVQSTLLTHMAMAHFVPPTRMKTLYKNHNERIYWIHTVLIPHLNEQFKENFEALDRMYRLLKNYGNKDLEINKKPGSALNDTWLYSDVHTGVARTCLELKFALNKCTNLDMFLDSCALNKQVINLDVLNKDIDNLIDEISRCLVTMQNSQIRLKKLKNKFTHKEQTDLKEEKPKETKEKSEDIIEIENFVPEVKDEVYYFVKTEDNDDDAQAVGDVTIAPGKKEREATRVVLNELKRKLVRREDLMRERERQALMKTMPELKDKVPEFPRQILIEDITERKGFISKLRTKHKHRLFKNYKIKRSHRKREHFRLKLDKYEHDSQMSASYYVVNENLLNKRKNLVTVSVHGRNKIVTKWFKCPTPSKKDEVDHDSSISEGLRDAEVSGGNKIKNEATIKENEENGEAQDFKFSKKDLELTPSSSDSDFESYKKEQNTLLKDIRRHRAVRRKNYPVKRDSLTVNSSDVADESLKPIEYSFGTGMAMASVLQINNLARVRNINEEEVFIGDGEVSSDSGNDEGS